MGVQIPMGRGNFEGEGVGGYHIAKKAASPPHFLSNYFDHSFLFHTSQDARE